jgi:hypothetical protein
MFPGIEISGGWTKCRNTVNLKTNVTTEIMNILKVCMFYSQFENQDLY